jgi:hypothetical protein
VHQQNTERVFQLLYACRKCRLGHAALLGSLAEVFFPRQGDEELELVDHASASARPAFGIVVEAIIELAKKALREET